MGFIDRTGRVVIRPQHRSMTMPEFSEGRVPLQVITSKLDGKYGFNVLQPEAVGWR